MTTLLNTEIKRDRITKDYAVYVDGELIGYGKDYKEAEQVRSEFLSVNRNIRARYGDAAATVCHPTVNELSF
jgi:hypothetical protein